MKRNLLLLLLLFVQIFNSINSLEIKCENTFDKDEVIFFLRYCEIKKTAIREPNATISTIEETVRGIQISNNAEAFYLPIEVNTNFPNLELYDSWGCSIGEISRSNFEGLNKLTYLQLANNFIERIESETFVDLHALKHLNLGNNLIKFISPDALHVSKSLMYVDLDSNICIDSHFGDTSDTSDFKSDELLDSIAKSCSIDPPEKVCPYVQPAEVTREKPFTADDVQTELNIQQETGAKLVSEIEKLSIVVSDLKAETLKLESQKMDKRKAAHAEAAKEKSEKFDCLKQLKAFSLKQ